MNSKLRLSKESIKVLYDNLSTKEKMVLKTIGDLDVASKTDIQNTLRQRLEESNMKAKASQYWFDKSLHGLEAMMFVSTYKQGTKVLRRLTQEGAYAYSAFILEIGGGVNDTALL